MRDGREYSAFLRPNWVHLLHERIWCRIHEVVVQRFLQDRRREGTKFFAELDLRVDEIAHIGAPRVGKDAPVAERTRPPLHPPLEPAHLVAIRNQPRAHPADGVLVFHGRLFVRPFLVLPRIDDRGKIESRIGRSPIAMLHDERARLAEHLIPYIEGRAKGRSIIARSGLNVELLEWRVRAHLAVRNAVHRATAGKTQPRILRPVSYTHLTL